ncbi:MAG: bifunctional adenosylcobinamide kinase/adenosylcobinamide-phosphate guanylyltransferase [Clostridiales bacterium]|nr:bifunctional adenosylcobinamide kinase/adenosylcobinamide-phosphate guanylyltransferase [Clostridiales bacterium]
MVVTVIGGSGSGKSKFAENTAVSVNTGTLIYIAAMMVFDDEGRARIARHRALRDGKGFKTIEKYTSLKTIEGVDGCTVLLECMSNLLANEMFDESGAGENAVEEITEGINLLVRRAENTVVVTNDIFCDGEAYDEQTMKYIENLGKINRYLASVSDEVYEVVCGIPIKLKGEEHD